MRPKKSVALIGMPGSGKSTIGRELSRQLKIPFVDTDHLLIESLSEPLQKFLDRFGEEKLKEKEAETILALKAKSSTVISTGGSAVYSAAAMKWLASFSDIVYLKVSLPELKRRIPNLASRGIIGLGRKSLAELFQERQSLYEKYASVTIDAEEFNKKQIVATIMLKLCLQ
jgi:shikimate kinase